MAGRRWSLVTVPAWRGVTGAAPHGSGPWSEELMARAEEAVEQAVEVGRFIATAAVYFRVTGGDCPELYDALQLRFPDKRRTEIIEMYEAYGEAIEAFPG